MIILLGNKHHESIRHLSDKLSRKYLKFAIVDTREFLRKVKFTYSPNSGHGILDIGPTSVETNKIKSVLWASINPPKVSLAKNASDLTQAIVQQEANCLLQSFLSLPNINWCNSWLAYQSHKTKPLQLAKALQLGATIPQTLVGNIDEHKRILIKQNACIEKPVHSGFLTRLIIDSDLQTRTNSLSTVQSHIRGINVRTYLVGNDEFSATIESPNIDFRYDQNIKMSRIKLPNAARTIAFNIMKALHMKWTAIDWILNENGEYVFLEANPAPLFVGFEATTGYPITQSLIALLHGAKENHLEKQNPNNQRLMGLESNI